MPDEPIWAVCLYRQGESLIEFVRAADRDQVVAEAINLNESDGVEFDVTAAALMPEEVL